MKNLTQSQLHEKFNYNPDTGILTRNNKKGKVVGNLNNRGYLRTSINKKTYAIHRIIWLYVYGVIPTFIDHKNHDKEDNRIKNLREVTRQGNSKNRKIPSHNKSGVMGVCYDKRDKKWRSQIMYNGKAINLGYFKNKEDAIIARKKAEVEYGFHKNHGAD